MIAQGTEVKCHGLKGFIIRHYDGDQYEIITPAGICHTADFEVVNVNETSEDKHPSKLDVVFCVVMEEDFFGNVVPTMIALDKKAWEHEVSENVDEYNNKDFDEFWRILEKHDFSSEGDYGEYTQFQPKKTLNIEQIIETFIEEGFYYSKKMQDEYIADMEDE